MGIDRENQVELQRWEARKGELRRGIVDKRALSREALVDLAEHYLALSSVIYYPRSAWEELRYHERQWLRVEAAGRTSNSAILVGRSAARMHGMWVISTSAEHIELALPSGGVSTNRDRSQGLVFRRSKLLPMDIGDVDGHRLTTGFRTFADIARYHGFVEGLVAADYLLRRGFDLEMLHTHAALLGRAKGIGTVRKCLDHAVANSDSPYESLARGLLIQAGIGPVTTQYEVAGRYADLCIDGWLLIEIDGEVKYQGPDAEQVRQKEFRRQKRIANQGYVFLRYSPGFLRRNPETFVQEVRDTLVGQQKAVRRRLR